MGPLEDLRIPLAQVEQADDAQYVQQLYGDEAQYYGRGLFGASWQGKPEPPQ